MEQSCFKCGQAVEQGTPFCPHCSAPQIRVVIAEPPPIPAGLAEMTASPPGTAALPASQTVPVLALPMQWSHALKPCALAALVSALLMALGLNPFVAMLCVGFLAVLFFRQRTAGVAIKPTMGAGLGALAGLLWFAISAILELVIVTLLHKGPEIRSAMLAKLEQTASQTSDPQVLAMFDRLKTPGGLEIVIVSGLLFAFVAALLLGSLGGAVGAALLGRRNRT